MALEFLEFENSRLFKYIGVRLEPDERAAVVCVTDDGQIRDGVASLKTLAVNMPFLRHLNLQPFRERVDNR